MTDDPGAGREDAGPDVDARTRVDLASDEHDHAADEHDPAAAAGRGSATRPRPIAVEDPADPRLADYVGLTDAALRRAGEAFVCEGALVLERAVALRWPLRSVLLAAGRERAERVAAALARLDPAVPVYVAPQAVLNQVVGFDIHRGVLASARRPAAADPAEVVQRARTVAVLEGVNDAENLGALYRNAAAFGVDAVLLDPTTADPWSRRAVRVSLGHVLAVPTARVAADEWPDALTRLGLPVVALTPSGASPPAVLDRLDRVALLLGAEGPGLSPAALRAADHRVRIPMADGVDSVNVATAAAIAFARRFG